MSERVSTLDNAEPQAHPEVERNKAVRSAWVERINAKDLEGALTLLDESFVNRTAPPGMPTGKDGASAFFTALFTALPDVHTTTLDVIAEGDKVAGLSQVEGTHTGEFMGIPATGKKASWLLMDVDRYVDGKVVEHWDINDYLGMMQQLGLLPLLPFQE